jgi:chromosome segregation ATPase
MLDSKLSFFFNECKQKTEAISKEIASLRAENLELEKIVASSETECRLLQGRVQKTQLQFDQCSGLERTGRENFEDAKNRLTRAQNDYCNVTKALQQQRVNIGNSERAITEKLQNAAQGRKERQEIFREKMKKYEQKIAEIKERIQLGEMQNTALRLELLEKDLKDSYRVSSIMEHHRRYSNKVNS